MSVVKDAERIGDYAKNLYDLAKFGVDFEVAPDRAELEGSTRTSIGCSGRRRCVRSRIPNGPSN